MTTLRSPSHGLAGGYIRGLVLTRGGRVGGDPCSRLLPIFLPALFLALLLGPSASPLAAQDLFGELRSVTDGVYTEGQAEAGAGIFRTLCVDCHSTADLTGRDFLNVWTDRPLYALWEFLTTRMPYGAPGSLSAEEYAQVMAYILQLNRYPAGEEPLPHTPLDVASIDMVMPAEQDGSRR